MTIEELSEYDRVTRIGVLERSIADTWRLIGVQSERHGRIDNLLRHVAELERAVAALRAPAAA
jgi:hypothetical protein